MRRPIIGITMGDASGIGPEIILKSLQQEEIYLKSKPLVIGDLTILERDIKRFGYKLKVNEVSNPNEGVYELGVIDCVNLNILPQNFDYGHVNAESGNAAYQYIERAVHLALNQEIDAICTAPLNKEALHMGGHLYPGHTEILATLTNTDDYSMMLSSPQLKVIHLTTHIGLIDAINAITPERTYKVIKLAYETFTRSGKSDIKIAVCGINPHAGENGLFGYGEEEEKLVPAIEKAKKEGINVSGPHPADTAFFRATRGDFDIVVACYHDQGHGPIKVLGLDSGVNVTVGLKKGIIRTSVDHGTAFDIAGKGIAGEGSMIEALKMAINLAPKN